MQISHLTEDSRHGGWNQFIRASANQVRATEVHDWSKDTSTDIKLLLGIRTSLAKKTHHHHSNVSIRKEWNSLYQIVEKENGVDIQLSLKEGS